MLVFLLKKQKKTTTNKTPNKQTKKPTKKTTSRSVLGAACEEPCVRIQQ